MSDYINFHRHLQKHAVALEAGDLPLARFHADEAGKLIDPRLAREATPQAWPSGADKRLLGDARRDLGHAERKAAPVELGEDVSVKTIRAYRVLRQGQFIGWLERPQYAEKFFFSDRPALKAPVPYGTVLDTTPEGSIDMINAHIMKEHTA